MPTPAATDDDDAWRAARRRAARQHHPDLGGSTEAYMAALAEVDAAFGRGAPTGGPRPVVVTTSLRRRLLRVTLRGARDASRSVRQRLPPGVPGSRRWGNL
ncbi:hypothetical protein [Pseudokineococcus sp. 1T1Z-3]|uniref:hypothetical protein n=1 Tax=Pseudokineococcus sp. 1T1Z-3 TaxID=3132745 RepID=UPI0030AA7012